MSKDDNIIQFVRKNPRSVTVHYEEEVHLQRVMHTIQHYAVIDNNRQMALELLHAAQACFERGDDPMWIPLDKRLYEVCRDVDLEALQDHYWEEADKE